MTIADNRYNCTCLGSCKGAAGLSPGWRCVIESPPEHVRIVCAMSRLIGFASTCQSENIPTWMAALVEELNKASEAVGSSAKYVFVDGVIVGG